TSEAQPPSPQACTVTSYAPVVANTCDKTMFGPASTAGSAPPPSAPSTLAIAGGSATPSVAGRGNLVPSRTARSAPALIVGGTVEARWNRPRALVVATLPAPSSACARNPMLVAEVDRLPVQTCGLFSVSSTLRNAAPPSSTSATTRVMPPESAVI